MLYIYMLYIHIHIYIYIFIYIYIYKLNFKPLEIEGRGTLLFPLDFKKAKKGWERHFLADGVSPGQGSGDAGVPATPSALDQGSGAQLQGIRCPFFGSPLETSAIFALRASCR